MFIGVWDIDHEHDIRDIRSHETDLGLKHVEANTSWSNSGIEMAHRPGLMRVGIFLIDAFAVMGLSRIKPERDAWSDDQTEKKFELWLTCW